MQESQRDVRDLTGLYLQKEHQQATDPDWMSFLQAAKTSD